MGQRRSSSKLLSLAGGTVLLAVIAGLACESTPESSSSTTQQSSGSKSALPQQIIRPSIPPPKFQPYRHSEGIDSIVVPVTTSDEQLKSLLWLFREKVRSHQLKDTGLKDRRDGLLLVYRGKKCATEQTDITASAGPCGDGYHDAATYQWGIEGDYNKDTGFIQSGGEIVTVFDYKDGWQANGTSKEPDNAVGVNVDGGEASPDKMTHVVVDGGASIAGWRVGNSKLCNWHVNGSNYRSFLICPANSIAAENEIVVSDFTPQVLISYPAGLGPSSSTSLNCTRYSDRSSDGGSRGPYLDCH